jgi:hypothetical protein
MNFTHQVRFSTAVLLGIAVAVCSSAAYGADREGARPGLPTSAVPPIEFHRGNVTLRGLPPGGAVGWMALVRERIENHIRVSIHRGVVHAASDGEARITDPSADAARAIWAVAPVTSGNPFVTTAPGYPASPAPIESTHPAGASSMRIEAAEIYLLYVHPPAGTWFYDGTDGSDIDADHAQNGTIDVPLSALQRLDNGPPKPPDQIEGGDYILLIDPRLLRSAVVVIP